MGTFFLFYFVLFPLLVGLLAHLWSIRHHKKRPKNSYATQPQPRPLPKERKSSNNLCIERTFSRIRREMEDKREEQIKPMRRKISLQNIDVEDAQKQSQFRATTTSQQPTISPPMSPLKKSSSTRSNCLCSPTTHVGSFRCRLHRHGPTKSNMRRGYSVGSNLSDMASKFSSSSNPPLASSTLQMSASSSQMQ